MINLKATNGTSCIDEADTAWVSISFVLVLGMMPALAFFEAGLLRSKNTLSIISQIFSGIAILSTMWNFFGYSLTFGTDQGGVIGNLDHAFLMGVSYVDCNNFAANIPSAVFAMFTMMFAAITPLLMTGSFAERLKFRSFIILIIGWEIVVYYPVAHWIWGGGWLYQKTLDFAGGIVIHTTAGTSCLVAALLLGRRRGFDEHHGEFPPSNIPLAALGAALLWMGWFGFNAGSALIVGENSTSAIASTQIASSISGFVWLIISWIRHKPSTIAVLNGVIAGLAGVTPASGYISSQSTIVLGVILGVASYYSVIFTKRVLRIDDALDVSSLHGLTGVIGSLFLGFCIEPNQKPINNSILPSGIVYGGDGVQLGWQCVGVAVSGAWAALMTYILMKIIDWTVGLEISEEEEEEGLDNIDHGESAYDHSNLSISGELLQSASDDTGSIISFSTSGKASINNSTNYNNYNTNANSDSMAGKPRTMNSRGSGFFYERTKLLPSDKK